MTAARSTTAKACSGQVLQAYMPAAALTEHVPLLHSVPACKLQHAYSTMLHHTVLHDGTALLL
jgi:hypothetical protein